MKAKMLKIAGVKTEAAFYKKYPTQEAFMKVHGKEFKKAQMGAMIDSNNNGVPDVIEDPYNLKALTAPGFGQTANYADTQSYNSQPVFLGKPPMADDDYTNLAPIVNPNYGKKQQRASALYDHSSQFDMIGEPLNKAELKSSMKDIKSPSPGNGGIDYNPFEGGFNVPGALNLFNSFVDAGKAVQAEKKLTNKFQTWANVSDVVKDADISNAFVQQQPREYYKPDALQNIRSANELYRTKGRGTDVYGQNGSFIGGNPTEIQNTYDGENNVYTDLEDPDDVKAYQNGGNYAPFLSGSAFGEGGLFSGNTAGNSLVAGAFGNNAYTQFTKMIPGPLGLGLTAVAGYLDKEPGKQRNAQNKINSNQSFINRIGMGNAIHNQFNANVQNGGDIVVYEDGGYMNPEYNPQVITMFGDHTAEDFADYAHKFRSGGHLKEYTAPSERAMQTYENGGEMNSYAMGGKIQAHWGGNVEDVSYNPYMPGSGITSMINGKSHKYGGVGISYTDSAQNGYEYAANGANMGAQIEAEGGEPMVEMPDGGEIPGNQNTSAVVIGNIPAKHEVLSQISDNTDLLDYVKQKGNNGVSMKSLFKKLTKEEIAANKLKESASKIARNADQGRYGQLDEATAKILKDSGEEKLKTIANVKMGIVDSQTILNKIKEKRSYDKGYNISAEELGRTGKEVRDYDPITKDAPIENPYAKSGKLLKRAQNSATINLDDYETNIIKNIQDAIGIDPKTPGYGKVWGPKSNKALFEYDVANGNKQAIDAKKRGVESWDNSIDDIKKLTWDYIPGLTSTGYKFKGDQSSKVTNDVKNEKPLTNIVNQDITEEQYNDFVKKYESSKSTKGKANKNTLEFQRAYHKAFPQEALAAIQKTTRENGLSNKAKQMGLTVEDILAGKDVAKILQSNEDQYHGPRTDQYMASIRSHFNKVPDLKLNPLGKTPTTTVTNTTKPPIGIVPLKDDNIGGVAGILSNLFQRDNIPPIDPRQFAGEYVAAAQNTPEPVPMQQSFSELDPIYRVSYQDVRNASTADFRDALRQGAFDPAAAAAIFGKKAALDQTSYADEFRTNQALEQQIYGGNRAKVNQDRTTNLGLRLDQANKQAIANSKTEEINQKIASSFADKNMKYDADVLKYNVQRNLFPNFGFDPSGRIHTQGAWYKPVIPQVYGGKSTIQEVPVYGADGKVQYYKMQETGDTTTDTTTVAKGVVAKNGKSIVKNAKNSSVVKAYKNL